MYDPTERGAAVDGARRRDVRPSLAPRSGDPRGGTEPRRARSPVDGTGVASLDGDRADGYLAVLADALRYARARDYAGPDYADGMSSRLLQAVPLDSTWLNLAVQEFVKRAPVDVRPLLRVEHRRNFKGVALFAMANQTMADLVSEGGVGGGPGPDVDYAAEAESLVDWLVRNQCDGYSGFCGSHQHEVQLLNGVKAGLGSPGVVSTSYAVKALLRAADLDQKYPRVARSAADFVVEDLDYREVDGGAKIRYHLAHPTDSYTLNAAALGGRLFVDLYGAFGDEQFEERARKILDHVAGRQTELGGWPYRIPPSASHLSMDTHHNGFVIECLQRYHEVTGSSRYADTLEPALDFFRETLFEPDGAPNFDEENAYPRDIHASAQGLLVFTYAGEFDVAERILDWTLEHLAAGPGRFYFRKHRFHTKRVTLMRWCQAWMAYAISEFLARRHLADIG